jgi:hypothetical protein
MKSHDVIGGCCTGRGVCVRGVAASISRRFNFTYTSMKSHDVIGGCCTGRGCVVATPIYTTSRMYIQRRIQELKKTIRRMGMGVCVWGVCMRVCVHSVTTQI